MAEIKILRVDKHNYTNEIIKLAAFGALLAGTAITPGLPRAFAGLMKSKPADKDKIIRSVRNARSRGWVTFRETAEGVEMALTKSGRLRWKRIELDEPLRDRHWDKKWRIVLFDIPVSLRQNAFEFRTAIKQLGFKQVQRSVWLTPYKCEAQITALRQLYGIKPYVRMCEVSSIENEAELIKQFDL